MLLFFNIIFEFIVFQNCLVRIVPFAGKMDELLTLIFLALAIIQFKSKKNTKILDKTEYKISIGMIIFIVIGILSTLVNKVQTNNIAIYKDILAISKFIVLYISATILSYDIDKDLLLEKVSKRARIYMKIIFGFAIANLFIDIGMSYGMRFGLRSYCFLYEHPTYLVASMVMLLSVIIANYKPTDNKIIIQSMIILILTFRSKAIVLISSFLIISYIIRLGKKIQLKHILAMASVGLLFTYQKIAEVAYYGVTAARPALYIIGYKLASKYFPLGSGFGSFASSLSGEYYSSVYHDYGISSVMGLTPDRYNYMADTFWPYIYGQFGVIGFTVFIIIVGYIYISLKNRYVEKQNTAIASTTILVYILIASMAEAIFTDVTGSFMFIILGAYLGYDKLSNICNKKSENNVENIENKNEYSKCM